MSEIDKLEAGPALDLLIAQKIMGWHGAGLKAAEVGTLWSPSTHIAHAWEVFERVKGSMGWRVEMDDHGRWKAGPLHPGDFGEPELYPQHEGRGSTASLAICRAALKAAEDP